MARQKHIYKSRWCIGFFGAYWYGRAGTANETNFI